MIPMLGTIVNTITILTGSVIGSVFKKGIREKHQNALFTAMGLAATGLGINSVVQNMPKSTYPVLFIVSLALGSLIGTSLELDTRFPWGGVQLQFTLKNSLVEQVDIWSDSMDAELSAEIRKRLTGLRFGSQSFYDALIVSEKEQLRDVAQFLLEQSL